MANSSVDRPPALSANAKKIAKTSVGRAEIHTATIPAIFSTRMCICVFVYLKPLNYYTPWYILAHPRYTRIRKNPPGPPHFTICVYLEPQTLPPGILLAGHRRTAIGSQTPPSRPLAFHNEEGAYRHPTV